MIDYSDIDKMSKAELDEFISFASTQKHKADKKQHAIKILLNSLYGALGTNHFRLYNVLCAEAITKTGQTVTAESFELFNTYLDKVTKIKKDRVGLSDTDSAGIDMTDLVNIVIGKDKSFDEKITLLTKLADTHFNQLLENRFNDYAKLLNSVSNKINMKREKIASAILVAKKNYVVNVYDNEGVKYATPKMSVTGLESVKASTPPFFRKKLEEAYSICFQNKEENIHKFIEQVHSELSELSLDELAGTTTVNGLSKYSDGNGGFISGTPGHVRGAFAYNKLVEGSDIYEPIKNGNKVKILQLKEPNPVGSKNICYTNKFPSDLIPLSYIDREKDYQKFFIKPIKRVLDVLEWNPEYVPTLDDMFG